MSDITYTTLAESMSGVLPKWMTMPISGDFQPYMKDMLDKTTWPSGLNEEYNEILKGGNRRDI